MVELYPMPRRDELVFPVLYRRMLATNAHTLLTTFFRRDVCKRATAPLKAGVEIGVSVEGAPALTLTRTKQGFEVLERQPNKPDMTFSIPLSSLEALCQNPSEDVGEIGIAIIQLMAHSDPEKRMGVKVHAGMLDLLWKGYLNVLPLGGSAVMKQLGTMGFSSLGKIKDGISKMRE